MIVYYIMLMSVLKYLKLSKLDQINAALCILWVTLNISSVTQRRNTMVICALMQRFTSLIQQDLNLDKRTNPYKKPVTLDMSTL